MHGLLLSGFWLLLLAGLCFPAWGDSNGSNDSSSALRLAEDDLERLAEKLHGRSMLPGGGGGGFHFYELALGMLLAGGVAYLVYWRYNSSLERALTRKQKGEAIQALQDMDTDTLRRLLGNVNLPSWVNFPDFERVNWVNLILVQLWPYIAFYVTEQSKPLVNQSLEANRPAWMESIKLLKFDLGEQAPKISGIKLYRQEESSSPDEILMECDFMWSGQQNVEIIVQPVPRIVSTWLIGIGKIISKLIRLKVSMKKLIMNGRLRLTLTPLLKDIPFVGTVQVSFTDMPDFSFDLQVLGGDITLLPGLEAWLNAFVRHSLLRPYVLPDKYTVQLTDADLGIETPKGILFVQLLEAQHVPRMDLFSKSDPYCKLGVRASRMVSSQVMENNLNPKWDEDFKLLVHEPEHQVLRVVLYDHDTLDTDDLIGEAKLPLTELKSEETRDLWLDVDRTDPKKGNETKYKGAAGKADKAKDMLKEGAMRARKKLGREKDKTCRVHVKVTYYEFQKDEVDAALDHHQRGAPSGHDVAHDVAERVHNKDAFNILMGGVLYVKPLKAHALAKKPWYKGGLFVKRSATVVVHVAEQTKKSATGEGKEPAWGDTIEFILGANEIKDPETQNVGIELWDYKAAKSFQGEAQINLKDILDRGRMRETYRLKGVEHGDIELECQWFKVLDMQPHK